MEKQLANRRLTTMKAKNKNSKVIKFLTEKGREARHAHSAPRHAFGAKRS